MQLWPIYMAVAATLAAVTWFTDRTAFWGFLTVLCGLLAMRAGSAFPPLYALTVWSVAAAIIYSTGQSILACIFAVLIPLPYLFAVFGWPWGHAAFWADVPGICLVLVLAGPTGLDLAGIDRGGARLLDHRDLPAWPRKAAEALVSAQARAPKEALEREF